MTEPTPIRRRRALLPPQAVEPQGEPAVDSVARATLRQPEAVRASLLAMAASLNGAFIDRATAVKAIQLALLTGLNYLLVGGPGTGKTAIAEAVANHIQGARMFAPSALGAYTTLSDLVGERDIPALMQGESRRKIDGRLPATELAFLDELFKASDSTVNTLLSLFNERKFEGQQTPLWSVGAATNWPEVTAMKPVVRAFWDRLHFRCVVEPVTGKAALKGLLRSGRTMARDGYAAPAGSTVTVEELRVCAVEITKVAIPEPIEDMLLSVYDRLGSEKIEVSGRRLIQLQAILQASAWLAGRVAVSTGDFLVLLDCVWTKRDDITKVRAILDTVDAEALRQLIRLVDAARAQHRDFAGRGWTNDRAQEFLMHAASVASQVADAIDAGTMTAQSEADVRRSVEMLKGEVEAVLRRFGAALGI